MGVCEVSQGDQASEFAFLERDVPCQAYGSATELTSRTGLIHVGGRFGKRDGREPQ